MLTVAPARRPLLRACSIAAGVGVTALALWLVYGPGSVGIDALWSLAWGRDLAHLDVLTPSGTTTPHVLSNLLGLVLTPFGADADRALVVVQYLGAATLVWCAGATARLLAGLPAALLAAVLMASREQLLYATRSGFLDVLAAALVAGAALCLVRARGERWHGAGALLALAGLLRPEPWVVLAILTAWRWRQTRRWDARLAAMTVIVPLLWAACDWTLSGDVLFSLHETSRVSDLFRAGQGIADDPATQLSSIPRSVVRAPGVDLFLVVAAAAVLLWRRGTRAEREREVWLGEPDGETVRLLRLLTAGAVLLAGTVAAQALTGTLLFARFSLPLTALVVPVAAAVLVLWGRERFRRPPAAAAAIVGVVLVALASPLLVHARRDTDPEHARYEAARAAVRPGVPCGPVVVPGRNLRAAVTVWTGRRANEVIAAADEGVPARGSFIDAVSRDAERFALDPSFPQHRLAALGIALLRSDHGWIVRAACPR